MATHADAPAQALPADFAPPPMDLHHNAGADKSDSAHESPAPDSQSPDAPPKKKQKRNKPTLSCDCCVERKTKVCLASVLPRLRADRHQCDRSRPQCLACIKRQSECRYSEVANLIASAE